MKYLKPRYANYSPESQRLKKCLAMDRVPATDKQKKLLIKLGKELSKNISKFQASLLISSIIGK